MKVLNVAEKPSVAKEIANILSSGRAQRRPGFSQYNAIFEFPYEIQGQSVQMVVTSVTGHLMELDFEPSYRSWYSCDPVELFEAPVQKKIRGDETQKKIEKTLVTEARQSQWLALWLDCDREGENIAFEVKSVCERGNRRLRVFRARFSALIPNDIVHAVQHLSTPDERLSMACDARSEIDLRIGAAFTRFQTMRIQSKFPGVSKEKSVISYGPCQFPTLGFVVERFLKIQTFEKEPFYSIAVTHKQGDLPDAPVTSFTWKRARLFDRMACLCIYESLMDVEEAVIAAVDKRATKKQKPLPLTTVELQKRASRWLRMSSEQTMKAAESLYNKGFISYPRTETNKFKEGTDLMALIRMHENHDEWGNYVSRSLLNGGKYDHPRAGGGDDQAHPPIHPTKSSALSSISDINEKKVYELVARHFLACCSMDAKGSQTNVQMRISHEHFTASGLMVEERNYLDIYKYEKWNASAIPVYQQGDSFRPSTMLMVSGETAPPPLLTEADLIAKMDSNGIGTDATIAEHIKTILKREYAIKVNNDTQFQPTTLGLALVLSYENMGLELAKPVLRAAMENDCKAIALGRKDIRNVIQSCMSQMRAIFLEVSRSAGVLDQTFSETFNEPPTQSSGVRQSLSRSTNTQGVHRDSGEDALPTRQHHRDSGQRVQRNGSSELRHGESNDAGDTGIPRCEGHGLPCIERVVSRDGPNKGRVFFVCPRPQSEQCNFFAWASDGTPADPSVSVKCSGHNEACVERTVKKEGPNKGRCFYSCRRSQMDGSCGFFLWKDEAEAAASGTATSSSRGTNPPAPSSAPKCSGHDVACTLRTTRKPGANQNRQFYTCALQAAENCGFFLWKDEHEGSSDGRRNPESRRSAPSSSSNQDGGSTPTCECGLAGILLTCRNGTNKGRTFFKCPNEQGNQCGFFEWAS